MRKILSIIIPIYNEERTLKRILERVNAVSMKGYEKEIIVVDDGSTDKTGEILEKYSKQFHLKVLRHRNNCGKGKAVRTGLARVSGEVVIIQDADLEYDPREIPDLLEIYIRKGGVVYGSRNLRPKRKGYPHYVLGVWVITRVCNLLFGSKLTDMYTGYKLFPSNWIKELQLVSDGFEFEAEVTAKMLKKGREITEVAINYEPRKFGEGKKINIYDGVMGIWILFKERLTKK